MADASFKFNLNTKNLIPKLKEDNSIVFYNAKEPEKAIFAMQAPFMYDAAGSKSDSILLALDKTNTGYTLTLTPDDEWLNSKDRSYPVTLDPTMQTSLGVNDIFDAHVSSGLPNQNNQQSVLLGVGYGTISQVTRTYIKFNLPALTTGDIVTNAKLFLSLYTANSTVRRVNAHKVLGNWDSATITWNNAPGFNPTVQDYYLVQGSQWAQNYWDITSITKDWYTTGNNYGLMLKNNDETVGYNEFVSSDTSGGYTQYRPQVIFNYVNNTGLEGYWTYHSQDISRAGTSFVNDYNGNLILLHNDLSMSGNKMPVSLNHVFNSNDKDSNVGYGLGWRLNVSQRIVPQTIGGTQYYVYTDEDGTRHYFYYDSASGTYKDDAGPDLVLTINGNGTYDVKDKQDNKLNFTSSGYLNQVVDSNGNTLTLTYSGTTLVSITDGAGRVTTLNNQSGLLQSITDPSGRTTSFGYSGSKLTTVTYPDGKQTIYTYDANNKLLSAKNHDGYTISYEYFTAAPYRVKKVKESHTNGTQGGELSISYGNNTTTFTDVKGRKNVYQFNNAGNTVALKDDNGYGQYYKYLDSNPNKNKLELESKLQKAVTNLLLNHNAEAATNWTYGYDSTSTGSGQFSTENKYMGNQSLKLVKTNSTSRNYFSQNLTLQKDQPYTFSGYIKTNGITSTASKGAHLLVLYKNNAGAWQEAKSAYINGTKDWERYQVAFTIPADATSGDVIVRAVIEGETGTAYFDALQLEDGPIANRYNLVENPDLKYGTGTPSFWTKNGDTEAGDVLLSLSDPTHPVSLDSNVFKMEGKDNKQKALLQYINVSGQSGDAFVIGGWAKGDSVPLQAQNRREFGLSIGFRPTAGGDYHWYETDFNVDANDWQYVSNIIIPDVAYDQVVYYVMYYGNANTAYFDGLQLYKEEFGQRQSRRESPYFI